MLLRAYLPDRSPEDVLAETVRVRLGGEGFVLPVLSRRDNRQFKATAEAEWNALIGGFDAMDDQAAILSLLGSDGDRTLRVLRAYDVSGVLPDDDWMDEHATDGQLLKAALEVVAAAYPTAAVIFDTVAKSPESMMRLILGLNSPSSNGRQPVTAGTRGRSKG